MNCVILIGFIVSMMSKQIRTSSAYGEMLQNTGGRNVVIKPFFGSNKIERNLRDITLKVLVHEMDPYTMFITRNDSKPKVTGFLGEMWNIMEAQLGFRSEYRKVLFMEGKDILRKGEADIMLTPINFGPDNFDDFENSDAVTETVYYFFIKSNDNQINPYSYLLVFSQDLWISYFGIVIFCTILLWSMTCLRNWLKINKAFQKKEKFIDIKETQNLDDENVYLSLKNCIITIFGYLTQQDTTLLTNVYSLRILLLTLLMFSMLMGTTYSSILVSRLTVSSNNYQITLNSIPYPNNLYICVRSNSAVLSVLQMNGSLQIMPKWRSVVNKGPCHPNPTRSEEVETNVCKDGLVILESRNVMSKLMDNVYGCQMVRVRTFKVALPISILFRKHLRFSAVLKEQLSRMKSSGVLQVLKKRHLIRDRSFLKLQEHQPVTMNHVKALVSGYGLAILLSALLLTVEIIVYRRSRKIYIKENRFSRRVKVLEKRKY